MKSIENNASNKRLQLAETPTPIIGVIKNIYDEQNRQRVTVIWDVYEGIKKDFFKINEMDLFSTNRGRDNRIYLYYNSTRSTIYTKQKLDAISASNPGFNAKACWENAVETGDLTPFIGKIFGAVVAPSTYTSNGKEIFVPNNLEVVTDAQLVRDGMFGEVH